MGTVNVSSSDTGKGVDSNEPLNNTVKVSFDVAFGVERWQLTKGSTWPYQDPYRVVAQRSQTSVVVVNYDPYDAER